MLILSYKTKKDLKARVGKPLCYQETSMFGAEYTDNGVVLGCNHPKRSWYAKVTLKNGLIQAVE